MSGMGLVSANAIGPTLKVQLVELIRGHGLNRGNYIAEPTRFIKVWRTHAAMLTRFAGPYSMPGEDAIT